nr:GntR family transcriptional regulator [uncultured Flavobacterium sp.]
MKYIPSQSNSPAHKYKKIVFSLEKTIKKGEIPKEGKLPSVKEVSEEYKASRKTVLEAFKNLKKRGIIYAVSGKGYYVKSSEVKVKSRVFLLFDELNSFKEDLYNSIVYHMGKRVHVDIFFHHFNPKTFEKHISEGNNNYTKYIIMPTNHLENVAEMIGALPHEDVYILDQINDDLNKYPAVFQDFYADIYNGLLKGKSRLKKYNKLILIFPGYREPEEMKEGFLKFVYDFNFNFEIISDCKNRTVVDGEVYILPNDQDLVAIIENSKDQNLVLGTNIGVISYNDTPLKKVIENGITTISTNFETMGKKIAKMTFSTKKYQIANKSNLIIRNSL